MGSGAASWELVCESRGGEPRSPRSPVRLLGRGGPRRAHAKAANAGGPSHAVGVPAGGKTGSWAASAKGLTFNNPHFLCRGHALWLPLSGVLVHCAVRSPAWRVPVCCVSLLLKGPSPVGWLPSPQSGAQNRRPGAPGSAALGLAVSLLGLGCTVNDARLPLLFIKYGTKGAK